MRRRFSLGTVQRLAHARSLMPNREDIIKPIAWESFPCSLLILSSGTNISIIYITIGKV